ncbi:solute carrier family 22 member 3-like isoform X2 [Gigantopelta aegis]|uniref:solute carrier family 22 member 3-like isoform X2 n=1 Tax=Gigantopelta aegis TaxID=1735272 RepID=UPI001B889DD9|nr:solute carrier family 22 member 3-like isoform X2 [Gigantopelta aegis]
MESVENVDVDEVWKTLGRFGRYQLGQLVILIIAGIPMAFHIVSVVFIGKHIDHVCSFSPEADGNHNASVVLESCKIQIVANTSNGTDVTEYACSNGYNYTGDRYSSFVTEWDLVCERDALGKLSQTLVMVGMFLGASFLPIVADRFGRKRLHVGSHSLLLVVTVAMAFVPSFIGFAILRVFVGIFQEGYLIPLFIIMLELFPAQQKEVIGFLFNLLWGISILLVTPIAYCMQNYSWRSIQLVLAISTAFSIIEFFILDESVRWLVANKRTKEAIKIVKKACKMNHKDFDSVWQTILERSNAMTAFNQTKEKERTTLLNEPDLSSTIDRSSVSTVEDGKLADGAIKLSFLDLLKNRTLRSMTLIVTYAWFTNSMTYYGLMLLSTILAGDPYINFLLGGVLEIPANILLWFLLAKIGRKKTCIFFHTGVGLSLLITVLVALAEKSHTTGIMQTVFSLDGRFFIAGCFNAVWIYTPELFPTNIRLKWLFGHQAPSSQQRVCWSHSS